MGDALTSSIADVDLAQCACRGNTVQTAQTGGRVPGNDGGIDALWARLAGNEDLGGGQLVELADDAVAGRARQT